MLLPPGEAFDYDGGTYTYPDIRLVYWAGGNPFHHHQDLDRLRRALGRADTVVVHEPYWTAMARHADIVLPHHDPARARRHRRRPPRHASHRDASRRPRPRARRATTTRSSAGSPSDSASATPSPRAGRRASGSSTSTSNWRDEGRGDVGAAVRRVLGEGGIELPFAEEHRTMFERFRSDPEQFPLRTPSGRIELASDVIAGFGYDDCPGHPAWIEPDHGRRRARFPLHLIANQPATRLHGQLDVGAASLASKVQGREPIRIHPDDAAARGIADGDVVRVFNDRGACLAGAVRLRRRCARASSSCRPAPGSTRWSSTTAPSLCVHGNPNVLTEDRPTSRLSQGCAGQHALVQIERFVGPVPPIRAHEPPALVARSEVGARG